MDRGEHHVRCVRELGQQAATCGCPACVPDAGKDTRTAVTGRVQWVVNVGQCNRRESVRGKQCRSDIRRRQRCWSGIGWKSTYVHKQNNEPIALLHSGWKIPEFNPRGAGSLSKNWTGRSHEKSLVKPVNPPGENRPQQSRHSHFLPCTTRYAVRGAWRTLTRVAAPWHSDEQRTHPHVRS